MIQSLSRKSRSGAHNEAISPTVPAVCVVYRRNNVNFTCGENKELRSISARVFLPSGWSWGTSTAFPPPPPLSFFFNLSAKAVIRHGDGCVATLMYVVALKGGGNAQRRLHSQMQIMSLFCLLYYNRIPEYLENTALPQPTPAIIWDANFVPSFNWILHVSYIVIVRNLIVNLCSLT